MENVKTKIQTSEISSEEYSFVSKKTGEVIEFERDVKVFATKLTNDIEYNSTDYSYLDNNTVIALYRKGMKYNEFGVLMLMSPKLLKRYNVCMYDETSPYTANNLSKVLGISTQATRKYINRLIELNVLAECRLKERKDLGKVLILNPSYLRKGRTFSNELSKIFEMKI